MKSSNKKYYALKLGDHLYYHAFIRGNPNKLRAVVNTTHQSLAPYHAFLSEAIKAERKRGNYQVHWEELPQAKVRIRLKPTQVKLLIFKPEPFLLLDMDDIKLKDDKNRLIYQDSDKMITFSADEVVVDSGYIQFTPDSFPQVDETIELNGVEVEYTTETSTIDKTSLLYNQNNKVLTILSVEAVEHGFDVMIDSPHPLESVTHNSNTLKFECVEEKPFEKIFDEKKRLVEYIDKQGLNFQLSLEPRSKVLTNEYGDYYTWRVDHTQKKYEQVIQLLDDDRKDTGKPDSEHFFDDSVQAIYQGKNPRDSFRVLGKKAEEKTLVLFQEKERVLQNNEPIKISVSTEQLRQQCNAIQSLNDSPTKEHAQLIKLFERKSDHLWKNPRTIHIDQWFMLTDESYDGTTAQQRFVEKAISTPDFAILEGPPGSGKTTAIIELILQLAQQGKKILLSASTNVAIDNVLERITDYNHIVEPLRIGGSIDEAVQQYQIDNKIKDYKEQGFSEELAKKITLDSANLVCGTTMGIQRHPHINPKDKKDKNLPVVPEYDYLIIDESSKTTFQEFLVPALHAKKWILVGDIKQLSPFVEQSHIVHNFNALVSHHEQQALRLAFEALHHNKNPYVIEVHQDVIFHMNNILSTWSERDGNPYQRKIVSYLGEKQNLESIHHANDSIEYLLGSDLILLESGNWKKFRRFIPKTHIIILKNETSEDSFFFQQAYLHKKGKLPHYEKVNRKQESCPLLTKDNFKIVLTEQTWAEAIAWRMIRVYERRMLKNPNSYYEKSFAYLKPTQKDNAVDRIYNMTLPSILESLQVGNGEAHRNSTTITEGFDNEDLELRHECLDYQHRMHPDISTFSREEFYTHQGIVALQDGKYTDRVWEYLRYPSRAVWLDVPKKHGGSDRTHQDEVKNMTQELKAFISFAENHHKEDGKPWTIATLTFYRPQETLMRKALRTFCRQPNKMSRFEKSGVEILNYTVDRFQGMEADIVFLSMVRGQSIGFLDNINRLNVGLTRAKYQRVIVGDVNFFKRQKNSKELQRLAEGSEII